MKKILNFMLVLTVLALALAGGGFLYRQNANSKYKKAVGLYEAGKTEEALAIFESLKKLSFLNPNRLDTLYYHALLIEKTNPDESLKNWESILKNKVSDQIYAEGLFNIGKIYFDKGDISHAKEKFSEVINSYSANVVPVAKSMFYMGQIDQLNGLESYFLARQWYEKALKTGISDPIVDDILDKLGEVNISLLFSPIDTPESQQYRIRPGDSLANIATKYNTSIELIKESNRMEANYIRPNDLIKVPTAKFSIVISKKLNTLTLYANGNFFKRYRVGTGKYNKTPEGTFKIINKLKEPVWYKPDGGIIPFGEKGNLLGTRWMGINFPGYGIHGTWEPDTIGYQSSAGCVRLLNDQVEELFKIVPIGTEVVITG